MLVEQDKAYLLHAKPYREKTLLASFLTEKNGKITAIINHNKSGKNKNINPIKQCHPMIIKYQLSNGISKVKQIELLPNAKIPNIKYFMLYQYINELILVVLPEKTKINNIFISYCNFLNNLNNLYDDLAIRILEIAIIDYFENLENIINNPDFNLKNIQIKKNNKLIQFSDNEINSFKYLTSIYYQQFSNNNILNTAEKSTLITLGKGAKLINLFFINKVLGNKKLKTKNIYRELQSFKII